MNLEPKAQAFLAALDAAKFPRFEEGTPEQARALTRALRPARKPRPLSHISDHKAPAGAHAVPIRLYRPGDEVPGCILYLHGGGWVLGDIEGFDGFARELAFATGWAVALVEYRLAPEHPFPAGLDDANAALHWLAREGGCTLGLPSRIVVMGDSAGGNLAAVLTQRARGRGAPEIAGQILAYPVMDASMATSSYREFASGPLLTAASMAWFWSHYIPDERQRGAPEASPLRSRSFASLPPTFVLTPENDPLRDEGEAYATALADAGVSVRLKRYDGQIHSFLTMVDVFDGGAEALGDVADFLRNLPPSTGGQ